MNGKFKSVVQVAMSNVTTIFSGIVVGFLLPKMMSIESYGLYKTFTLYASYLGLFSLGIIDGIVLKYGGTDYSELNRPRFRSFFKWYFLINCCFAFSICVFSFFMKNKEYSFILVSLAIYMIAYNITGYFQQISQITMRFKELSIRKVLQSTFNIVIVVVLYLLARFGKNITYHHYVFLWIFANVILMMWYVKTYKDIIFANSLSLTESSAELKNLIIIGFPLLFANLCSSIILTLDRQFVNLLYDTSEYAIYAFAYNMLTLITVATSAISTVLYPVLKRTNKENLNSNYDLLVGILLLFLFASMVIYFPLSSFIKYFLPKYTDSIVIFRVIFPGLAISSTITVIMHNYYKVLGNNILFFKKSIVVLLISGIANYLAYLICKTTISISAASIITMIFWYLYSEHYFVQVFSYKRWKNFLYIILVSSAFYVSSFCFSEIAGCVFYCIIYGLISFLFYKTKLLKMKELLKV